MAKTTLIIIDDVHLEGRPEEMHVAFAKELLEKINKIKNKGDFPVLVCAGDIGEGDSGIKWVKQFDCDTVYVCGNHEFWNGDYFKIIESLKSIVKEPGYEKIRFLHNEDVVINGVRFLGATLWTDLGVSWDWIGKNQILAHYSSMADFKNIKAFSWFEQPSKKAKLIKLLSDNGIQPEKIKELLTEKMFNPALQIEEYDKSLSFLNNALNQPFEGRTVVVTHHLPTSKLWMKKFEMESDILDSFYINDVEVYKEYQVQKVPSERDILRMGFYVNNLDHLLKSKNAPEIWVHGHFHQEINDYINRTRIASSPVGYMRQSEEFCFKEIFINYELQYLLRFLKTEVDGFDWEGALLSHLDNFESVIKNYYRAINSNILEPVDFIPVFNVFIDKHKDNVEMVERKISDWFYSYMTLLSKANHKYKNDYFITSNISGFHEWATEKKVSGIFDLSLMLTQNSFLPEKNFAKLLNQPECSCSADWINEIKRFKSSIETFKMALKAFFDDRLLRLNEIKP